MRPASHGGNTPAGGGVFAVRCSRLHPASLSSPPPPATNAPGLGPRRTAEVENGQALRLHDNATSGNAYKVRLLLTQLGALRAHRVRHRPRRDPHPRVPATRTRTGASPCSSCEDGSCLPESNAILWYLAEGTPVSPPPTTGALAARAGAAVDVLRAVQPRAEHRDRPLLDHPSRRDDGRARGRAARQAQARRGRARR